MKGTRHIIVIGGFLLLCSIVIVAGKTSSWKRTLNTNAKGIKKKQDVFATESYFSDAKFHLMENDRPVIHMRSSEMSINGQNQNIIFTTPKGVFFSKDDMPVHYEAQRGLWLDAPQELILNDDINLRHNDTWVKTAKLTYNLLKDELVATGDVESRSQRPENLEDIEVFADKLYGKPKSNWSRFTGNVKGTIKRTRGYEESVFFSADRVDLDLNKSHAQLEGQVNIKKQRLKATSLRGEIFLENYNKKLKYFTLYDDVVVIEKVILGGGSPGSAFKEQFERKAYADTLEGFMKDRTLVLTGYPKVIQRDDVIKGNVITLREDSEIVEVDDANSNFKIK